MSCSGGITVLLVSLFGLIHGDHFWGAMIFWKQSANGHSIDIDNRQAWRRTSQVPQCNETYIFLRQNVTGGNIIEHTNGYSITGFSESFLYACTDFSIKEDWQSGTGRAVFEPRFNAYYYEFQFVGCCWIETLKVNPLSTWALSMTMNTTIRKDTGKMNESPRIDFLPILRLQYGSNHTVHLPVSDSDKGDKVKCRWATGTRECGGICNSFPHAILDEDTCTLTYSAVFQTGRFAVAIQIEDFNTNVSPYPLSSVPLQFIVSVENMTTSNTTFETARPKFVLTLPDRACIGVTNNSDFSTVITIQSGSDVGISELDTVSPVGLVKSALQQSNQTGNWHINVTWNPNKTDTVSNVFCFTAVDDNGLSSELRCITLLAGVPPANIIASSRTPNNTIVSKSQSKWSIEFDKESQRPTKSAFINLYLSNGTLVESIDVLTDRDVNFTFGATTTRLQFSTHTTLQPGQEYYFLFGQGLVQGTSYCGAESKPILEPKFWRFSVAADINTPCNIESVLAGQTKYPHPTDYDKFLLCDAYGNTHIVPCPPNEVFSPKCSQCAPAGQRFSSSCEKLEESITNPCTTENILAGNFYFPDPNSKHKFIQCDISGHYFELNCPFGEQWSQTALTCILSPINMNLLG